MRDGGFLGGRGMVGCGNRGWVPIYLGTRLFSPCVGAFGTEDNSMRQMVVGCERAR